MCRHNILQAPWKLNENLFVARFICFDHLVQVQLYKKVHKVIVSSDYGYHREFCDVFQLI